MFIFNSIKQFKISLSLLLLFSSSTQCAQQTSLMDLPTDILNQHIMPDLILHKEYDNSKVPEINFVNKKMYLLYLSTATDKKIIFDVKTWRLSDLKNNLTHLDQQTAEKFKTSFKRAFINLSNKKSIKNNFIEDKLTVLFMFTFLGGISAVSSQFIVIPFHCSQELCIGNHFVSAWNLPINFTSFIFGCGALGSLGELFNPLNSMVPLLNYNSDFGHVMLSDYLWLWYLNRQL